MHKPTQSPPDLSDISYLDLSHAVMNEMPDVEAALRLAQYGLNAAPDTPSLEDEAIVTDMALALVTLAGRLTAARHQVADYIKLLAAMNRPVPGRVASLAEQTALRPPADKRLGYSGEPQDRASLERLSAVPTRLFVESRR